MGRGGVFRAEAVLPLDARSMFIERDSAAFRSLLSKSLKIGAMEFRDMWHGNEGSTFVRLVTKPEFGAWVPAGVAGSVNAKSLEFHDIVEYKPAEIQRSPYRIFVRTESPLLGNKLDIALTLTIEEVDEHTCRQSLEGHIRVGIFGVGRVVEGIVKESLHNTYRKLPDIVQRWQEFRTEALRSGNARALLHGRPPSLGTNVSWIQRTVKAVEPQDIAASGEVGQLAQQPTEQQHATVPESRPSPTRSPSTRQSRQHLQLSGTASQYFDAEEAPAEEPAEEPASLVSPETAEEEQWAAASPRPHHARNISVDSVGLAPGADVPAHKASEPLWQRFNRLYDAWGSYWAEQGVEEEAEAAHQQEMDAAHPSLVGQVLGAVGRELYYGGALLVLVAYLGLTRRGMLDVRPDTPPAADAEERWRRSGSPLTTLAGTSAGSEAGGLGRQISLDQAEAAIARATVKAKASSSGLRVFSTTSSSDAGGKIAAMQAEIPGKQGSSVGMRQRPKQQSHGCLSCLPCCSWRSSANDSTD